LANKYHTADEKILTIGDVTIVEFLQFFKSNYQATGWFMKHILCEIDNFQSTAQKGIVYEAYTV
jgi:uncharacterized protein YrrD